MSLTWLLTESKINFNKHRLSQEVQQEKYSLWPVSVVSVMFCQRYVGYAEGENTVTVVRNTANSDLASLEAYLSLETYLAQFTPGNIELSLLDCILSAFYRIL